MLILLVDTAGPTGGVLLARSEGATPDVGEAQALGVGALPPREASTQMIPVLAELLRTNRFTLADVDGFAVVSGPGSFTGLRVGLSVVKALAETMAKPVVALSRLAVMASIAPAAELVHVVLDAGRGDFYHGIYRDAGWTCESESLETLPSLVTSLENIRGALFASEPPVLNVLAKFSPRQIPGATVSDALPLALAAWRARCFTDVALLDANYLRSSNPETARNRGSDATGHADPSASAS